MNTLECEVIQEKNRIIFNVVGPDGMVKDYIDDVIALYGENRVVYELDPQDHDVMKVQIKVFS